MPYRVEQAIFTSLRGDRLAGYQLASRSGGVDENLAQQLSTWGPAHDSLETKLSRNSVNVHPLSENLICIAYTQLAGDEYSGRGGGRVYTHSFILPAEALAPFHFNPFIVLRAFRGAGRTQPRREPPPSLESFELIGRASGAAPAYHSQLNALLEEPICEKLVWALSAGQPVFIASNDPVDAVVEAALTLLPAEDRQTISLSTSLRLSPRRPFQLQGVPADPVFIRQLQRNEDALVVQLPRTQTSPACDTKSVSGTKLF
jgi:hypothetical protein